MGNLAIETALIEERIKTLRQKLLENYRSQYNKTTVDFNLVKGKKYYKLVLMDPGASVHCFISRQTGAVYKPATWQRPAAHARYNLLDDISFAECLRRADWAGNYLYLR